MVTPIKDKVYARIPKGLDISLHIKLTKADGLELVNIRDFIRSLEQYGRGVVFDVALLPRVIEALQEMQRQVSNTIPACPQVEQGKLFE